MRVINLRLLLIAVVVLLVIGGGVHLLHSFQVQRNADFFLDQAEKAAKAGKPGEQAQNLQWYLKLVPDDVEATSQLGLVLADLVPRADRPAYDTLEKALRLDPANTVARRRQVDVAIRLGRYSDARDHLLDERLLKQTLSESELLLQMGRCQEALGKYASADNAKLTPDISGEVARGIPAAVWYEAAIATAPDQLRAYVDLAGLLRNRLNQKETADEWMKKLVEANPKSAEAHVYYGQYLLGQAKDTPQAEAEARRALELEPDHVNGLLLAAQCAIEEQRYDEARTHAARALELELDPRRQASLYATLADIEFRSGQSAAAIAWLEKGLEANPGNPDLLWQLTRLLIEDGQLEKAESRLAELEKTSRTPALVEFLRARKTLAQEQWLAASRQFEQARANLTPWPSIVKEVDFYLGECYRQLGNSDQQLTAYRRALSADPFWIPARAGLAEALRSMGRIEEALEEYRQIMKLGKAPAAGWIDLAQLTLLDQLRRNRTERNWSEVDGLIDRAEQANPEAPGVAILRAEALVARDQIDAARKLLEEAETRHPASIELRLARVSLAQQQRQWDEAEGLLNDAQKQLGDSVSLRLGWAQHWLRRLGSDAKPRIQELAANSDGLPKNDLPRLWEGLAVASLRTGDFELTRQLCRKISVELPNRLRIWLTLFDLAIRANDDSDLAGVVSEIHRIEGGGPLWQYARALQLVLKWNGLELDSADASKRQQADADLREAMDHLASAATARPAWSLLYLLTARIHELRSQPDMALEAYTRAIDLGSREPQAIRRAIGLLYERQRYAEAYALIQRLSEQQSPFSADLARLASDVSLRLDDFDRALELARNNARDSTNYLDHVWLGQVLTVMGMAAQQQSAEGKTFLAEAEQSFRKAITLKVDAPDAWVALILFFGQTGDTEKAEAAIAEAQQKIPRGMAPLALAQCYEAMGRMDEAEKSYQQALAADPEGGVTARKVAEFYLKTGKPQPGEEQLRRIAEGKVKVEEADLVWGRRALALVLAGQGGFSNLEDGLSLVEENLNRKQIAPEDQRVKAILLSSHPKRAEREEAIRVLEDLLDKQPKALPDDRFILARLYLTQGDWANGSRHMRALLASSGNDEKFPLYVATYIRFLLDRKEIGEAELWLTRLEKSDPKSLATAMLRAEASLHRRQADRAVAALKATLDAPGLTEEDRLTRIGLVASNMADLSLRSQAMALREARAASGEEETAETLAYKEASALLAKEAEDLYAQYTAKRPEQELLLAAFYGRVGRVDDALAVLEQSWEKSSLNLLSVAMLVLLQETNAQPEQLKRAEAVLSAALEKHQRPAALLMLQADLRSIQSRWVEAETIYREILKSNPRNITAINNLAVLLAVQRKNLDESLKLIDDAIRMAGPSANLLDSRAMVLMAQKKPADALSVLNEVAVEGQSASLHFHRAQALYQLRNMADARVAFDAAQRAGLRPEVLHPLERPAYEQLLKDLPPPPAPTSSRPPAGLHLARP